MPQNAPTPRQLTGSEYSGVERTSATLQPERPGVELPPADKLRLGYLTGRENDTESIEDRRQMLGLLPADGARPKWLAHTGRESQAQAEGAGRDPLEVEP